MSSAAARTATGETTTRIFSKVARSNVRSMPKAPTGMRGSTILNETRVRAKDAMANTVVVIILPLMICQRGTGLISRGSSDLRSFSPAVVSIARCVAPVKAVIIST